MIRLRGNPGPTRYRARRDNTAVHLYLDVTGQHTVADLLAVLHEQGVPPEDVTFRGGCFVLTMPATPEDVAAWEQADAVQEERAREARRKRYEEFREEFGG